MTPEGRCPVCKVHVFVDAVTRQHPGGEIRDHFHVAAGKPGRRPPQCAGTGHPATELRWPNGDPYLGNDAAVRICWPGGKVYWEGE